MPTIGEIEIEKLLGQVRAETYRKESSSAKVAVLHDLRNNPEAAKQEKLEAGIYFKVHNVSLEEISTNGDLLKIIKSVEPVMASVLKSLGEFTYDSQFRATSSPQDYNLSTKALWIRVDQVYP
jgi:hypothetical protein